MTPATDPLLTEVESYLAASGMSPTAFGDASLKDRHFVRQLRAGRRVWPETADKVRAFMREHPPAPQSEAA